MNDNSSTDASLSRRNFLQMATLGTLGMSLAPRLAAEGSAPASPPKPFASVVETLDYPYDALEPHIDALTMEIHHTRHYAGYVNGLNKALEGLDSPFLESTTSIVAEVQSFPDSVRTSIRNMGGGVWNHELFWRTLSPTGGGVPQGYLANAVERAFGGFAEFQEAFGKAAATRFGSGWAWLCVDEDGTLFITTTPNQDNPLMKGLVEKTGRPILGLDVWEHAYYLKYQNRRTDYIKAWWSVVDWEAAEDGYLMATH